MPVPLALTLTFPISLHRVLVLNGSGDSDHGVQVLVGENLDDVKQFLEFAVVQQTVCQQHNPVRIDAVIRRVQG